MSDQKPEEENKPVDYLADAKDKYRAMNYLNSSYYQEANAAALIFIGEQLARIANSMAEGKFEYDVKFNADNLTEIMTRVKAL